MRSDQFLAGLKDYGFARAIEVARQQGFHGGWEAWFQVEIAMHMRKYDCVFEREREYPNRERCDFRTTRGGMMRHILS